MASLRFHLAVVAAKCVQKAIKLLGRNASHNPGVIALKICPNFMDQAPKTPLVICVTGTNGKTTVSNLLDYFERGQCPNELCYRCGNTEDCKSGKCF